MNVIKHCVIASFILCLASCVQHYTNHSLIKDAPLVPVYITGFVPDVRRSLVEAIEEWNGALNGHMILYVVADDMIILDRAQRENAIVVVASDRNAPMMQVAHMENTVAVSYPFGTKKPAAIIYMANILPPPMSKHVLLHELGHAFGAEDKDYSLMQLHYSVDYCCIDRLTMAQVSKAMRWSSDSVNWCE